MIIGRSIKQCQWLQPQTVSKICTSDDRYCLYITQAPECGPNEATDAKEPRLYWKKKEGGKDTESEGVPFAVDGDTLYNC